MNRVLNGLELVLLILGRISITATLLITVLDITSRNLLNRPIPGVVDLVEFSLAISIFAGIAVACWRGGHLAVDLLELVLPPVVLRLLENVNGLIGVSANAALAWLCYLRFVDALEWGDSTVDLGIPLTWFWVSPLIGFTLAALFSLIRSLRSFAARSGWA